VVPSDFDTNENATIRYDTLRYAWLLAKRFKQGGGGGGGRVNQCMNRLS
jgi:hypothetical protein